jgi:hypothetical protein
MSIAVNNMRLVLRPLVFPIDSYPANFAAHDRMSFSDHQQIDAPTAERRFTGSCAPIRPNERKAKRTRRIDEIHLKDGAAPAYAR